MCEVYAQQIVHIQIVFIPVHFKTVASRLQYAERVELQF